MRDFQAPGRSAVYASNGICATSHPLAAKVAIEVLEAGGNAVDAAIAGAVLLGICEPQMTGIGGDCFVLLKPAGSEEIVALNGSGRAPRAASAAEFRARGLNAIPLRGVDPVTIPGAIDAFCRLSTDWGKLGLDRALAPAIRYAEEGVPVAPRVAYDWAEDAHDLHGDARRFYLLDGKVPQPGQIFRAPGQAEVLRRIAREGRAGFYEGEVAEDMVTSLRALGGSHTLEDFAATSCTYVSPISGAYRGIELVEHPPNTQGATALLMLNILKHFDLAAMDPFGSQRAHIEAEAAKLAYDARNRFIAETAPRLDHMLSLETAAKLAALIDPKRALPSAAPLTEAVHKDTIYITVVDRDRMAVSLIYSIFWGFGAGTASQKFGINFQNRGAGFTLMQGHPERARRRQAPDAHHHPRHAAQRRPRHHALWRDGRGLSAEWPCPLCQQPDRLRHGTAGGHRRAAQLFRARGHAGGNRLCAAGLGRACSPGPRGQGRARPDRRRAGDLDGRKRRVDRGLRSAQRWLCLGVLR